MPELSRFYNIVIKMLFTVRNIMYEKDGIVYAGNPIPSLKVIAVQPLDNYRMRLEFSTGEIKEFDFTPLLDTPCFQPLREKALFDQVYLDRGIPSWDGGNIDIAPETLFDPGDLMEYTERGDKTRLISARAANKAEKRSYYGHDNDNRKGWTKAD